MAVRIFAICFKNFPPSDECKFFRGLFLFSGIKLSSLWRTEFVFGTSWYCKISCVLSSLCSMERMVFFNYFQLTNFINPESLHLKK